LGDIAWLFFMPFVLLAAISWLAPAHWRGRPDPLAGQIFIALGALFALVKTLPAAHALTLRLGEAVLGFPLGLRRDPSDLLALVALAAAWIMWRRPPPRRVPGLAPGVVALAAVLTIANSPAPEYGIACLEYRDGRLLAISTAYEVFASEDQGRTWQSVDERQDVSCRIVPETIEYQQPAVPEPLADPAQADIVYRFQPGTAIDRSEDGGQTWQQAYRLQPLGDAENHYYQLAHHGWYAPGPLGALISPENGDLFLAMGHEGLLVYRPAEEAWEWIALGQFSRLDTSRMERAQTILLEETVLALIFGLLSIGTVEALSRQQVSWKLIVAVILGWGVFMLPALLAALPPGADAYLIVPALFPLSVVAAGLIFVIPAVYAFWRLGWNGVWMAIGNALLFILPFILWALGGLPRYWLALVFAYVLGIAAMAGEIINQKRARQAVVEAQLGEYEEESSP
jgi:hypothetical protein